MHLTTIQFYKNRHFDQDTSDPQSAVQCTQLTWVVTEFAFRSDLLSLFPEGRAAVPVVENLSCDQTITARRDDVGDSHEGISCFLYRDIQDTLKWSLINGPISNNEDLNSSLLQKIKQKGPLRFLHHSKNILFQINVVLLNF